MMAPVTHSYIWNRYAAKTLFASLTKIERQEIILSIEYSITFLAVFVDKLKNQESYMHNNLVPRALFPGFPPPKPGKSALGTRLTCISAWCINNSNFLVFQNRLLSIQVSIFKTIGCRYELSLSFVLCLSFMFSFLVACGIKLTSTCFQVFLGSPTQV